MSKSPQVAEPPNAPFPVRDPDLHFDEPMPQLWFRNNAFLTFLFNGFNLTFPDGERMFVRAVHHHLPNVADPKLRAEIRAFSGQEGQHARAHERLFDALRAQGFDLEPFFQSFDPYIADLNTRSPLLRLGATAALEHYTSTLAEVVFGTPIMNGVYEPMRKLLIWHAAEELEHRTVAFDVLQAVNPSYWLRIYCYVVSSIFVLYWIAKGMRLFIAQSGTHRSRMWADFKEGARVAGGFRVVLQLAAYFRPSFHPSQTGSVEVALARLRAEGLDAPLTPST